MRSPTALRQRTRSTATPPACALASRASSNRTPIGAGERLPGLSPVREVAMSSVDQQSLAQRMAQAIP